jgi:hypothetical protein
MTTKKTKRNRKPTSRDKEAKDEKNKLPDRDGRVLLQVWVSKDVYAWLDDSATKDERSLASYVRLALARVKENPQILERSRAELAGFVSDPSMLAEAKKLLAEILDGKVGVRLGESHARELLHAFYDPRCKMCGTDCLLRASRTSPGVSSLHWV